MTAWNFADVWEAIADQLPDAPALRHDGAMTTWAAFDRRADAVAAFLVGRGTVEQDKVAQYLYNSPAYLESVFAAFKAGLAVVNTNYRYTADELCYLWDNADVVAVVFHGAFAEQCAAVRSRLQRITTWLWVDDGSGPRPDWAVSYNSIAGNSIAGNSIADTAVAGDPVPGNVIVGADAPGETPAARTVAPWGRSGDHLLLLYTGGTTGRPKGVMWRQDDLYRALEESSRRRLPPDDHATGDRPVPHLDRPGPLNLPAAPLMHGTGMFNAMTALNIGGAIVTLPGRRFDPVELLDTVERERVKSMSIVGDAFAKPILRTLDAEPDRWDISSLRVIVSSGVIWSKDTKDGLLGHNRDLILVDALGSSEAIGMATATSTADHRAASASFQLSPSTRVIGDEGRDVVPGGGERGLVAMRGAMPMGYYKDPEKSAATFRVLDGVRYTIPGDYATVDADGTVHLLGRGSQCINTGGEKVFPEEVEEALKSHPSVADAAVVGLPDDRFGEAIAALVEPVAAGVLDEAALIAHVKEHLAAYKAPKRIIEVASVHRAANGKLDYRALRVRALAVRP